MRGFIIIICIALSQAEKLRYNYGQGLHRSHNAFEGRSKYRGNPVAASSLSSSVSTINNGIGSGLDNRYSAKLMQIGNIAPQSEVNYNKEFYSYSAPEEESNDVAFAQRFSEKILKNLRVIFIKAPENNAFTNAALQLIKQTAESKTAIYVLVKETDVNYISNQFQSIQHNTDSKPEVHFIKYRTPEDAIRAQQLIQREYDALEGSSRVSNEEIAPVLDFSSKKENVAANNNINNISSLNGIMVGLNDYLSPKTRH